MSIKIIGEFDRGLIGEDAEWIEGTANALFQRLEDLLPPRGIREEFAMVSMAAFVIQALSQNCRHTDAAAQTFCNVLRMLERGQAAPLRQPTQPQGRA